MRCRSRARELKGGVSLLFWSGRSFEEDALTEEGSFQAAEIRYTTVGQVEPAALECWLEKARTIPWDYRNLVRRTGRLERLV